MKVMITVPVFGYRSSPKFLLCIQRGNEWKAQATMSEQQARDLASECRKRGLTASVREVA